MNQFPFKCWRPCHRSQHEAFPKKFLAHRSTKRNILKPQTSKSQMVLKSFLNKLHGFTVKSARENLLMENENYKCSQFIKKWFDTSTDYFSFLPQIAELDTLLKIFAFNKATAAPQEALCKSQHFTFFCYISYYIFWLIKCFTNLNEI